MNFISTKNLIDKYCKEIGIPYLEVKVFKGYEKLYEYKNEPNGTKEKDSVYLFSCTKVYTASLAMRLIDEGYISLTDKVSKYIPSFKNVFTLDENGNKIKPKNEMTLKNLMTMSGGVRCDKKEIIKKYGENLSTVEFISHVPETPLAFEPGNKFEYGFCLDVLVACMEVATGKKFSTLLNEYIFQPLGITSFGLGEPENHNRIKDIYYNEDGKLVKHETFNDLLYGKNTESGGAGLYGNGEDYCKLLTLLANGGVGENGYRLMKEKTLKMMRTEQIKDICVNNTFTCVQGGDYGYGLGVRVRLVPTPWGLPVGEFGWDGAAGTYVMIDPVNKISVYIGMHNRNWPPFFRGKHLEIVKTIYENLNIK